MPDLILLDWMLPGSSGLDLLGRVRESDTEVPYWRFMNEDAIAEINAACGAASASGPARRRAGSAAPN